MCSKRFKEEETAIDFSLKAGVLKDNSNIFLEYGMNLNKFEMEKM